MYRRLPVLETQFNLSRNPELSILESSTTYPGIQFYLFWNSIQCVLELSSVLSVLESSPIVLESGLPVLESSPIVLEPSTTCPGIQSYPPRTLYLSRIHSYLWILICLCSELKSYLPWNPVLPPYLSLPCESCPVFQLSSYWSFSLSGVCGVEIRYF